MPDPTLYLFDGYNILRAGSWPDVSMLVDELASFLALRAARGVVVFDGAGRDELRGALEVRYARDADALLERLAADHRGDDAVCLVSSDAAVRSTSGPEVMKISSRAFVRELEPAQHREHRRSELGDRVDDDTRTRLERLRRGE